MKARKFVLEGYVGGKRSLELDRFRTEHEAQEEAKRRGLPVGAEIQQGEKIFETRVRELKSKK